MNNTKLLIPIIIALLFSLGCDEPIPVKEMSLAKKAIKNALSVKCDKYAPKEFELAKKNLYKSHDLIQKNEYEKAKESAQISYTKAIDAYNIAIPLLAGDTIQSSEKNLRLASELHADYLAKNEYNLAKNNIDSANKFFENKRFYKAYLAALEANIYAEDAKRIAINNKYILNNKISDVKVILKKAEKYNSAKYAAEDVKLANDNLEIASASYKSLQLKKGFSAVDIAKFNAITAYTKSIKETTRLKMADAITIIELAEKSEGAEVAADELQAAKEAYNNASGMFIENSHLQSIEFSVEAIRLANIVLATKKPIDNPNISSMGKSEDNGEFILYTVEKRQRYTDCLWRLSLKFYKDKKQWKRIYEANKDIIQNPHLIIPGQVLKIPKLK
jgi:LysM domain-containing protein